MRRLTLATALILLSLAPPSASVDAAHRVHQCPTVSVSCPDVARGGDTLTYTAEISNAAGAGKLIYNWLVSAGKITKGQGTASITVDTTEVRWGTVEATVEVIGFPEACARKATCGVAVIADIIGCPIGEYGNIKFNDEKARLDNLAVELQNDPTAQGYIICYGGRVGRTGEAQVRCDRAKNDLVTRRSIPAERIVTVDGGYRENLAVVLWVVPSGATPPPVSPTVDPREVKTIRSKPKRKTRRR